MNKLEFLEKERNSLSDELKSKENYYREELDKLEYSFEAFQKIEEEKIFKEQEAANSAKAKVTNFESK